MVDLLKCAAASVALALLLYGLAVFISLEPDVREWEPIGRATLAWLWLIGSTACIGFVKMRSL